jgi:hypothetical protein
MKTKPIFPTLFLVPLQLLAPAAQAVPTLTLTPSAADVQATSTFTLQLQGSDFGSTAGGSAIDNVSGGQNLNLNFSAGIVELLGVEIAPRWTFAAANKAGAVDNAAGTLTGLGFGTFPATGDDSFDIALLRFRALAPGMASFSVAGAQLVGRVAGVPGSSIDVTLPSISVAVSAVPEPGSWALLASGLALVLLRSAARNKAGAAAR